MLQKESTLISTIKLNGYFLHSKCFCGIVALLILLSATAFAEGSKEINSNGGYRAFLVSGPLGNLSYPFPTIGTMKVYAKAGEVINLGSSAQGIGFGSINLRAPNGATYSSGNSTTIGLIANRNQEIAGPLPNTGGYRPYSVTVLPGQDGVWEVDFVSQNNGAQIGANPIPIPSNNNWIHPAGQYIAAFDISVRNTTNTAFILGRVYTNIFSGIVGTFDVGFNAIFKILTKDGYQYELDNNGQAGNGFSFFVNNKGFKDINDAPTYKSVNSLASPNIQDPRLPDTQSDVSHKIFFNTPSADLPSSAAIPGGGSTWLLSVPIIPAISNIRFNGIEGSQGKAGTNPLGANIGFNANSNGAYTVVIDINRNSSFTDPIDRKLTGIAIAGSNQIYWNGLDGNGNKVPSSSFNTLVASINVILFGGEVHFPFFDVERNTNGIKLTRVNGNGSPDNNVYWDDSTISSTGTPSNPRTNLTGINSTINGHKWGKADADPVDFGDERGLDTWSYISSTPLLATVAIELQEADLEVASITSVQDCAGSKITYSVSVKNNGPNNVTGAKFRFNFPPEISGLVTTSTAETGISTVISESVSGAVYNADLNMNNGSSRTFTLTANVFFGPAGGIVNVSASILRPADITDPDAINPDSAIPTDPIAECNSVPSWIGCNNVKNVATNFFTALSAGPDLTINQFRTAKMAANNGGIWSQSGSSPALALITDPNNPATTIAGFTVAGMYTFIFQTESGCIDSINVTVVPSTLEDTTVPTIFTPNGDGKNDTFEIKGLDGYPNSQLLIFNRWGNEVYRSENYFNTWNGSDLAEGTYFYVLNRKSEAGIKIIKGWVYLKR